MTDPKGLQEGPYGRVRNDTRIISSQIKRLPMLFEIKMLPMLTKTLAKSRVNPTYVCQYYSWRALKITDDDYQRMKEK